MKIVFTNFKGIRKDQNFIRKFVNGKVISLILMRCFSKILKFSIYRSFQENWVKIRADIGSLLNFISKATVTASPVSIQPGTMERRLPMLDVGRRVAIAYQATVGEATEQATTLALQIFLKKCCLLESFQLSFPSKS